MYLWQGRENNAGDELYLGGTRNRILYYIRPARGAIWGAKATTQREGYKPNVGVDARWHLVGFGAFNISQQHRRGPR